MRGHDIRFALRQMAKQPGFSAIAIFVLALGIGGSTAVFCVLYQALLKPPPYPNAQSLFFIHNAFPRNQVSTTGVSGFDYSEVRKHTDVFTNSGIFFYNDLNLTGIGTAQHVDVVNASASLFNLLGVKPQLGRTFSAAEDQKGADGTAILSNALWHGAFGSDPQVLGRVIRLNGLPYKIIGVMPRSFQFPSRETQLWVPVALRTGEFTIEGGRTEKWLHMIARLSPNSTPQRANATLTTITDELSSRFPAFYPKKDGWHFTARPLTDEQTERIRRWLYLAFGAVLSVLLISAINVSSLLLIRANARQSEISVRLALGATRLRILRQLLTETSLLAAAGCLLGTLLAVWAIHLINLFGPLPQPTPLRNWALLFAPALAAFSTFLAGILPAWLATRNAATRTYTATSRWRSTIIAAQIALAVTLLFTAVQLNRSFLNLTHVPPGFQPQHVWSGALDLPFRDHDFFEPLLTNLSAIPGVQSASGVNSIPFSPSGIWTERLQLPNSNQKTPPPESQIGLTFPGYFETIGIPLLRGRTFTKQDRSGSAPVAIIDEELARRYFPNDDPVGKHIASGGSNTLATIVGVVASVHNGDLGGPPEPEVYYPEFQERTESTYLVLRTNNDLNPTSAVRQAIAKLNPGAALYDVKFMDQRIAASLELRRFIAYLLNGLALTGLLLAIVGLYGSLAHLVELRQREIGIRLALGATRSRVVQLILTRGLIIVTLGLTAGTIGAIFAGRAIQTQLFGAHLTDPSAWLTVLFTILFAGSIAAYFPAWRAARIDPAIALRHE
jgi:predicted permease